MADYNFGGGLQFCEGLQFWWQVTILVADYNFSGRSKFRLRIIIFVGDYNFGGDYNIVDG